MFKRLFSMIAVLVICVVSVSNTVFAVEITPYWSYTSTCSSTLSISGKTATCTSKATGYSGTTTKIVISQTLQKKTSSNSWSEVDSWSETYNSFVGTATNYSYNLSSGTYRLKSVFTVYSGSKCETITKYSSEKTL